MLSVHMSLLLGLPFVIWLVCQPVTVQADSFNSRNVLPEMELFFLYNYDITVLLPSTVNIQDRQSSAAGSYSSKDAPQTSTTSSSKDAPQTSTTSSTRMSSLRQGEYKNQQMEEICGLFFITLEQQREVRRRSGEDIEDGGDRLIVQLGSQLGLLALALRNCIALFPDQDAALPNKNTLLIFEKNEASYEYTVANLLLNPKAPLAKDISIVVEHVAIDAESIEERQQKSWRDSDWVDTTLQHFGHIHGVSEAHSGGRSRSRSRPALSSLINYLQIHFPTSTSSTVGTSEADTGAVRFLCPTLLLVDLSVNITSVLEDTLPALRRHNCDPIVYIDVDTNNFVTAVIAEPGSDIGVPIRPQNRDVIAAAVIAQYGPSAMMNHTAVGDVQYKLVWHYPIHQMTVETKDPSTVRGGAAIIGGDISNPYSSEIREVGLGANLIIYPYILPMASAASPDVISNQAKNIRILKDQQVYIPYVGGDKAATAEAIAAIKHPYYDILPQHPSMAPMVPDYTAATADSSGLLKYLNAHSDAPVLATRSTFDSSHSDSHSRQQWRHNDHYRLLPSYESNLYAPGEGLKVRRVVDCFTFYNELEMLFFRLTELWDVVDYFVLAEATVTHSGRPKELVYEKHKHLFEKFHKKIVHVIVDDMPLTVPASMADNRHINETYAATHVDHFYTWMIEGHQRNAIEIGLKRIKGWNDDDLIFVSDVDELPSVDFIKASSSVRMKSNVITQIYKLSQEFYYYNLNTRAVKLKETEEKSTLFYWDMAYVINSGSFIRDTGMLQSVRMDMKTLRRKFALYSIDNTVYCILYSVYCITCV